MGCGCEATISESDPRAEIWMYVFGKLSFPLKHPIPKNMGSIVGIGYEGDATALTSEQRERLIEKMMEKFHITRKDVEDVLKEGIVPIKSDGIVVSWCALHSRMVV